MPRTRIFCSQVVSDHYQIGLRRNIWVADDILAEESALAPEALVARLQVAIVAEKKAALAHKAAARTPDAIHALRRAKLMTEEVEALG